MNINLTDLEALGLIGLYESLLSRTTEQKLIHRSVARKGLEVGQALRRAILDPFAQQQHWAKSWEKTDEELLKEEIEDLVNLAEQQAGIDSPFTEKATKGDL